jgi:hypothetical protein
MDGAVPNIRNVPTGRALPVSKGNVPPISTRASEAANIFCMPKFKAKMSIK